MEKIKSKLKEKIMKAWGIIRVYNGELLFGYFDTKKEAERHATIGEEKVVKLEIKILN